jgi:tetratricopeptide (TPR) repeat protein
MAANKGKRKASPASKSAPEATKRARLKPSSKPRIKATRAEPAKRKAVMPRAKRSVRRAPDRKSPKKPSEPSPATRAVRPAPRDPRETADSLFKAANLALDDENLDLAIESLAKAIDLAPENPALVQSRGAVYAMKGETRRAIRDYETAIEMSPAYADAHLNCGLAHEELGEHIPAVTRLTRAIELGLAQDAARVQAHYHRAGALEALGEFRAAIEDLHEVVRLIPDTPTAELSATRATALMQRISSA